MNAPVKTLGEKLGPHVSMALAAFAFSFMGVFVRKVEHIPTSEIVLFRSLVTLSFCLMILKSSGVSLMQIPFRNPYLWMRGTFGCVALTLTFAAIKLLPLAVLSTIVKLAPMMAAVLGGLWLKDRARPIDMIALIVGFIGVVVIRGFDPDIDKIGVALAVFGSLFSAVAYTTIRKLKDQNPTVVMIFLPIVAIPIFIIPSALQWVQPSFNDWLWLLLIGISVQIGQYFMTAAFQQSEAARVGSIIYTEVLLALLWGYLFFSETIGNGTIVGIVIILSSALLSSNVLKLGKSISSLKTH